MSSNPAQDSGRLGADRLRWVSRTSNPMAPALRPVRWVRLPLAPAMLCVRISPKCLTVSDEIEYAKVRKRRRRFRERMLRAYRKTSSGCFGVLRRSSPDEQIGGGFWLIEEPEISVVNEQETGLQRGLGKPADAASRALLGSLWEGSPSSPRLAALLPFSPARQRISLRPRPVRLVPFLSPH